MNFASITLSYKLGCDFKNNKLIALAVENFEDYCHEYSKCQKIMTHEVECILFAKNLIEDAIEYSASSKISELLKKTLSITENELTVDCWEKLLSYSSNPQACSDFIKNRSSISR